MKEDNTKERRTVVRLKNENHTILAEFITRQDALCWVDELLETITKHRFSLMGRLNEIQTSAMYEMKRNVPADDPRREPFPYKDWIPLSIVNLLLSEYNIYLWEPASDPPMEDPDDED